MPKKFIDDGVYVDFDGYNVIVTTEKDGKTTNRIALRDEAMRQLWTYYVKRIAVGVTTDDD